MNDINNELQTLYIRRYMSKIERLVFDIFVETVFEEVCILQEKQRNKGIQYVILTPQELCIKAQKKGVIRNEALLLSYISRLISKGIILKDPDKVAVKTIKNGVEQVIYIHPKALNVAVFPLMDLQREPLKTLYEEYIVYNNHQE